MTAKWLVDVFKDCTLRTALHDLARNGTHEQIRAALEAAEKAKSRP